MQRTVKIERRSTHSDLAVLLLDHAARLAALPPGALIGDASTVNMVRSAAAALIGQDEALERATLALRACYEAGYKQAAAALR